MYDTLYESLSIYATPGEGARYTLVDLIRSIDGMRHRELVETDAKLGDPDAISRIARVASGQGAFTGPAAVNHARSVLADLEANHPEALKSYLAQNGAQ